MTTANSVATEPISRGSAGHPGYRRYGVTSYVVFLLVLVALVEIAVGRTDFVWKLAPSNDIGGLLKLEEVVIAKSSDPRVLVFGSSRGREAFLPAQMEAMLGLQKGQVLPLAMGGINVLDALLTYQRNRAALSRADLVVLQLDPFQLSAGGYPPPARYRRYASWHDRMAYTGRARARLLADYVFGMDVALPVASQYLKDWLKHGRPPRQRFFIDGTGRLAVAGAAAMPDDLHEERNFTGKALEYWLHWGYPDYAPSPIMEEQLARFIQMVKSDGAGVYVVYLPTTKAYFEMLAKVPRDPYHYLKARLQRLAGELGFEIGWWQLPEDAGLAERDFADWGHLNRAGARKWTRHFVHWLESVRGSGAVSHSGLPAGPPAVP